VVAYPRGVERHWNDGRGAAALAAQQGDVDDVKFVRRLVDALAGELAIDRSRVFATGVSNGGMFCHLLALRASDVVTGVAPVIGGVAEPLADEFRPERPVSALIIQGDADPLVPIDGGPVGSPRRGGRGRVLATTQAVDKYVLRNGIAGEPTTGTIDTDPDDGATTKVTEYPPGPGGFRVTLYVVRGGGHHWPGAPRSTPVWLTGRQTHDFNATQVICDFFAACPSR